jgi:hypothetical protein
MEESHGEILAGLTAFRARILQILLYVDLHRVPTASHLA